MAFHFALDDARASALRAACAAHGEPGLVPAMSLERLRGLMTGKIDLVFEHAGRFHVLDYKGNWLGERVADYTGEALRAAMDHSHYRLQALLYSVAVHRLLAQRVPGYSPAVHLGADRILVMDGGRIVELFKQPAFNPIPIELQVAVLFAMQKNFFDAIDAKKVVAAANSLKEFFTARKDALLTEIRTKAALDKDLEAKLQAACEEWKASYAG